MKKKSFVVLMGIILCFNFFAVPTVVNAAGLVNCGKGTNDPCTLCHLVSGVNGVVGYITGLVAITAVLVITVAGVMYAVSAGNSSTTEMAKSAIKNAVIGVVITLTAFLIIHFVLKGILGVKGGATQTGAEDSATSWSITCN